MFVWRSRIDALLHMQTLLEILNSLQDSRAEGIKRFHSDHKELIHKAPGSAGNHQAWEGGYADHIAEVMRIVSHMYRSLSNYRPLGFSLESALIVLYFHDVEKIWKYTSQVDIDKRSFYNETLKREYHIEFDEEEQNALEYIHGENERYSNQRRVMRPLAAFCHTIDVISARIWFDEGKGLS